ncbi:hypothetical protein OR571_11180 [Psychrobacillus sp. NEAU-3TGS]|uniref:hypothetical protein n=1 Tax=Psychrobacillus sp. NEAU-3TGS TaxID=2995412 RepID=UPI0024971A4C|nr:hypothetical protein [Psychrobacillus sp. NEAU-3TGS]MDI2587660.1 hypothetical protein [Psychrobacillus sp. NEAU-3TGS]
MFADGLTSMPHIQDLLAVSKLKKQSLIPKNSVFIPGHSGDFVAGSHIPKYFLKSNTVTKNDLIESMLHKHYNLWFSNEKYQVFLKKTIELLVDGDDLKNEVAADIFEEWDWRERQAKYICNSVRVYEFYNYEWRLPLWDREIIKFWSNISIQYRVDRNLYFQFVESKQSHIRVPANPKLSLFNKINNKLDNYFYSFVLYKPTKIKLLTTKVSALIDQDIKVEISKWNKPLWKTDINTLFVLNTILEIENELEI